jgi:hypothetical protein
MQVFLTVNETFDQCMRHEAEGNYAHFDQSKNLISSCSSKNSFIIVVKTTDWIPHLITLVTGKS